MKQRKLLAVLSLVAASMSVVACSEQPQIQDKQGGQVIGGMTQIANPWHSVESLDALDDAIGINADFTALNFKDIEFINATNDIAQIRYADGSNLRIAVGSKPEDISGIYGSVASNYLSVATRANFAKYDDTVYAYWSNGELIFCYDGVKGQDEAKVDETVTLIAEYAK